MRFAVIGVLLGLAACGTGESDEAVTRGKLLYDGACTACHGLSARGDGPLAAELSVAPPDLTTLAAAHGGTLSAERVMEQVHGYPGRYHRGLMPEFGPVLDGPTVAWTAPSGAVIETPQALLDIVAWLETIQG